MIGHHTRFRENDDLPLWQGPTIKKKLPLSNDALIMHEIMCSRIPGNVLVPIVPVTSPDKEREEEGQ